jgi:hypothetical protein
MAIKVPFRNPTTTEVKFVKIGWSWTLFLWSGFFGIPLFWRGLIVWGFVFVAFSFSWIGSNLMSISAEIATKIILFFVESGLQIFMGVKGNEITAKHYLENGWQFADPQSDLTKYAKGRWGIFESGVSGAPPHFSQTPPFERDVRF